MCNYTEIPDIIIAHACYDLEHLYCKSQAEIKAALLKVAGFKLPCGHTVDHLIPMESGYYYCEVCSPVDED